MLPLCVSPGKVQSESRNQRHRLHSHQAGKSIIKNVYLSTYDFINKINNIPIIGKVLLQTLPYQTNIWIFRKIKCLFGFMIFQWSVFYLEKYIFPFLNFWEQFCYFPFKRNLIDMALAACAWGSGSANLFIVRDRAVNPDLLLH